MKSPGLSPWLSGDQSPPPPGSPPSTRHRLVGTEHTPVAGVPGFQELCRGPGQRPADTVSVILKCAFNSSRSRLPFLPVTSRQWSCLVAGQVRLSVTLFEEPPRCFPSPLQQFPFAPPGLGSLFVAPWPPGAVSPPPPPLRTAVLTDAASHWLRL